MILRETQKMVMRIPLCFLATLLATLPSTGTAGAEGEKANPKQGCPSSLFAGSSPAASPASGCRKGFPTSSDVPDRAPPMERARQEKEGQEHGHEERLFVFVSFSLPDATLKQLSQDAQTHKATLVMRGLSQNSFVQTARKIHGLGIAVDINPKLFEAHNVKTVPAFALVREGHPTQILKGNVTLDFALQKLKPSTKEAP